MSRGMVIEDLSCKQIIRGCRKCTLKAIHGYYCHQHKDRSYYSLVAYDTGISKGHINDVVSSLIKHMSWNNVHAFQNEMKRGQLYEDAGGYFIRAIGKLFGARGRYDELDIWKRAAKEATNGN